MFMNSRRFIAPIAALAALAASAQNTWTEGGVVYAEDLSDPSKLTVVVVAKKTPMVAEGESGYEGDISIPSTVEHDLDTYEVVGIAPRAFVGCDGLETLVIADGPTKIKEGTIIAPTLESLTLPSSVKSLKQVILEGITELNLGNGLHKVEMLFYGPNLERLSFPDATKILKYVDRKTFTPENRDKPSKLKELKFGSNLEVIDYSFETYFGKSLTIPGSCKTIECSFYEVPELTTLNIEEGVEKIINCFTNISSLETLTLPASCTETQISLVKSDRLKEINILAPSANNIYFNFRKCPELKSVRMGSPIPPKHNFLSELPYEQVITLYIPKGSIGDYIENWRLNRKPGVMIEEY